VKLLKTTWADAAPVLRTIIAAMTNATVTANMMRLINTTLSCSGAEEEGVRPLPRWLTRAAYTAC
jgi:hypothetical protein